MVKKYKRSGSETIEFTFCREEEVGGETVENEFEAEASVSFGSPGKTYGPPEDCYPAEGDEVEITGIWDLTYVPATVEGKKGKYVRGRQRPDLEALLDTDRGFRDSLQEQAVSAADDSSRGRYDSYIDDCIDDARDREMDL